MAGGNGITTRHKMYFNNNGSRDINTMKSPVSVALNSHSFMIYTCQETIPGSNGLLATSSYYREIEREVVCASLHSIMSHTSLFDERVKSTLKPSCIDGGLLM